VKTTEDIKVTKKSIIIIAQFFYFNYENIFTFHFLIILPKIFCLLILSYNYFQHNEIMQILFMK
jgi:hypothetical protein